MTCCTFAGRQMVCSRHRVVMAMRRMPRIYASVAELALCVSLLLEWRSGVLSAVQDAQRFHVAARERAAACGRSPDGVQDDLLKIAALIGGVASVSEVAGLAAALAAIPMPVG